MLSMVKFNKLWFGLMFCMYITGMQSAQASWLQQYLFRHGDRVDVEEKRSSLYDHSTYTDITGSGCCDFVISSVVRVKGKSRNGTALFIQQGIHRTEIKCKEEVIGKICGRITEGKRCKQEKSYVKAFVREVKNNKVITDGFYGDVAIDSGCSCVSSTKG